MARLYPLFFRLSHTVVRYALPLALAAFLILSLSLFMRWLPPHNDEEMFAEPSWNLLHEGRIVSHIVEGMDSGILWQPPLYFIVLSPVIGLFGFNLFVIRVFATLVGCGVIVLVYVYARKAFDERAAAVAALLLACNPHFLIYAKDGRMDGLCVLFILLSFIVSVRAANSWHPLAFLGAGAAAAAAMMTHPLGLLAPVSVILWLTTAVVTPLRQRIGAMLWFLAPIAGALVLWMIFVFSNLDGFLAQMAYQFTRKENGQQGSLGQFLSRYRYVPVVIPLLGIACWRAMRSLRKVKAGTPERLLGVALLVATVVVLTNFELSYHLYILPWACILFAGTLTETRWHRGFRTMAALVGLLAVINGLSYTAMLNYQVNVKEKQASDYDEFVKDVSSDIKPGASIVAVGTPSLYWGLREQRSDVRFTTDTFIDTQKGELAVSHADQLVLTRAFDPAEDSAWHCRDLRRMESLARSVGKRLVKRAEVGSLRRFAYSAEVYDFVPVGTDTTSRKQDALASF